MKFYRKVFLMLFIALFITSAFAMQVKAAPATWSVQYMIDQSQTVGGYSQFSDPRNGRGLALSPDGRYLYAGYNNPNGVNINKHDKQVRKIDTTVSDYTTATVAILQGDRGKAIATDDKGRVYLAEGSDTDTKDGKGIHIYDAALSTKLWTISSLTQPEGVATTREGGTLFLYATDRSANTVTKFAITEGSGVSITNVAVASGWPISPGATQLRGVEVDPNGKIWMADYGGNKVFRVNNDGTGLTSTTVTKAMDITFGYGRAYVTQHTTRTITVLKQSDLSYVETLTPPWTTLELDPDGQSAGGALSGIAVRESSGVLYVANEAGQTADEHSTYGRTDGESGGSYTDMTHDDNDPILKMAFSLSTLYVDPTPVTATVCSEFTIAVNIMDVTDLYAWQFRLSFDPNLLECKSVSEGPFLKSINPTIWPPPTINNIAGSILAGCSLMMPPGASGSGTLTYVTFHCKGAGACDLIFSDTILLDSNSLPIPHVTVNGHVQQVPSPSPSPPPSPAPVGGEWVPIDKLQLLVPWISLISLLVITTTSFVYARRKRTQLN